MVRLIRRQLILIQCKRKTPYAGHPPDPGGARVGFSATGMLLRPDFGVTMGLPLPGTTMGVGDMASLVIEAEFQNPDASGDQSGP